jgi:hypothetical protein
MPKRGWCTFAPAILLALTLAPLAIAQQPGSQPPPPQKAKPKAGDKRVWSDDDLQALRKPWDDYADQKAQAEQASTPAADSQEKTAPAKPAKLVTRDEYTAPKTVEEAQTRIAAKQREINYQLEAMQRFQQEIASEPNEQIRQDMQKRLGQMNADLKEAGTHLKLLQDNLKELKAPQQPQQAPLADSGTQPPSQPPL